MLGVVQANCQISFLHDLDPMLYRPLLATCRGANGMSPRRQGIHTRLPPLVRHLQVPQSLPCLRCLSGYKHRNTTTPRFSRMSGLVGLTGEEPKHLYRCFCSSAALGSLRGLHSSLPVAHLLFHVNNRPRQMATKNKTLALSPFAWLFNCQSPSAFFPEYD